MKDSKFKEMAQLLLKRLDDISTNRQPTIVSGQFDKDAYEGLTQLKRDFAHLVFAYDKDLPLNREIQELFYDKKFEEVNVYYHDDLNRRDELFFTKFRDLVSFFINYLETFYNE